MRNEKNRKNFRPAPSWLLAVLAAVLLMSCASAPRMPAPADNEPPELFLLPAGGSVYLWADAAEARPLLEAVAPLDSSGRSLAMMLDRTNTAAVAVFEEGQDRRFFLAAAGRYPRRRANFALSAVRGWEMRRGFDRKIYWRADDSDITLALGRNLALVSNLDPFDNDDRETPPHTFAEFRRGMAVAGWVNDSSPRVNTLMETLGIPIQIPAEDLFFGAARAPAAANGLDWDLAFRIRTPSETHARSLLALFSTARFFVQMGASAGAGGQDRFLTEDGFLDVQEVAMLFFANVPQQDGAFLTLRMDSLDTGAIALLFSLFSVYSGE